MALPNTNYDVLIGGNGFMYAINDQNPHIRQTTDYKRQQLDVSRDPGEQTLTQWWVRDQESWHRGSGLLNYDPGTNHEHEYRSASANNVNVWTQGQVQLGWGTSAQGTGAGDNYVAAASDGGLTNLADYIFTVTNSVASTSGTLIRVVPGITSFTYTGTSGTTWANTEPCIAGSTVLVGTVGGIFSGSVSGSSLSLLWTLSGGATVITPYWAKGRILATTGGQMWELTTAGGTMPATPTYTTPIPGGTWVAVAEAPDCILAALNAAGRGYIYRVALVEGTTTGSSPTLGAWTQVCEMPPGESIAAMRTYLGAYVALGTSQGIRVCDLGTSGQITMGPLTVDIGRAVYALNAYKSFILGANYNGTSVDVYRIDLGQEILNYTNTGYAQRTLRFAYNIDQRISTSASSVVNSVCAIGNQVKFGGVPIDGFCIAQTGSGIYRAVNTYVAAGTVSTGRIRFDTTENKVFYYLKVRGSIPANTTVTVSVSGNTLGSTTVATLTSASNLNNDIFLGSTVTTTPQSWLQILFSLATSSSSSTPVIDSWTIKAKPAPQVQRDIVYPLRLSDLEQDRQGLEAGYDGSAWARLQTLEALENAGTIVTIVDNTNGETYSGIITKVQFIRETPPSRNLKNYGGRVNVQILKVT